MFIYSDTTFTSITNFTAFKTFLEKNLSIFLKKLIKDIFSIFSLLLFSFSIFIRSIFLFLFFKKIYY
jgi:hypothetical protein